VDGGPLSLAVTAAGKERRGFDLSTSTYTVPAAITGVRALDPAAKAELVSQTDTQAVVKVTVEIDGNPKPGCVAETVVLFVA
jgi:hypothetical protein